MHGFVEYKVKVKGTFSSVEVTMPGQVNIELPDGTHYLSEYPQMIVEGLMSAEKIINPLGELRLTDVTNNHELLV